MSTYQIALLLHLAGVIVYFSGLTVTGVSFIAAGRLHRPSEAAALLSLARTGVILVGAGLVALVAFGAWLVDLTGHDLDETWLSVSLALLVLSVALGAIGGQRPKRARKLATELGGQADEMTPELNGLLHDPLVSGLNYLAGALSIVVLVLMVWRPGT